MESRTLVNLEFRKALELIARYAGSIYGYEYVESLRPSLSRTQLASEFQLVEETRTLLSNSPDFSVPSMPDIRPALRKVKIQGAMLDPKEILDIAVVLGEGGRLRNKIGSAKDLVPLLDGRIAGIQDHPAFRKKVQKCIDPDGSVKDNASKRLAQIRREKKEIRSQVYTKLNSILRNLEKNVIEDDLITVRNERYVIPVKDDFKGHVKGVVVDYSSTRTTAFIEPLSVVGFNNEIRFLKAKEKDEVDKILMSLSIEIAEHRDSIGQLVIAIAVLDSLYARARFCKSKGANCPKLDEGNYCKIISGRHPLLSEKLPTEKIVPQSFEIADQVSGVLITGPNAGGKTVCLKMIGLFHAMARSGLPVTAEFGTTLPYFDQLYTDIGDSQSIEDSLSTFSAHINHLYEILQASNASTLVLIDELGTGTDPNEGAALSMAILDRLIEKKARFIVTTHLSDLKVYGERHEDILNASMEFDEENFVPTFNFRPGIPGKSYAYEIAGRLGIDAAIIEKARHYNVEAKSLYEDMIRKYDRLIKSIEIKEAEHSQKLEMLERREKEAEEKESKRKNAQKQFQLKLEKEKEQYIARLKEQFLNEISTLKDKKEIAPAHRTLAKLEQERKKVLGAIKEEAPSAAPALKKGDQVKFKSWDTKGEVQRKLSGGKVLVAVGNVRLEADATDLIKLQPSKDPGAGKGTVTFSSDDENGFHPTCDLRGLKADDAIDTLDKYLDSARLSSFDRIIVIHGKGTGRLREAVNAYLKTCKAVDRYEMAPWNEGGSGAMVAYMKK